VFVAPCGDDGAGGFLFTYIGTTDTDYDGPLDDPQCTPDDIAYLLRAINGSVSTRITEADVLGTWAGLRPLVREADSERTADLSRRHSVRVSPSGVVTVTGGKLTTYRRMAADAVDEVAKLIDVDAKSRTKRIRLHGAVGFKASERLDHLTGRYGSDAQAVRALAAQDDLGHRLADGLPYLRAEIVYAARHEMARTVDDALSRRTRARLLARDASADVAVDVAALMAPALGWDDAECSRQVAHYRALVAAERDAAHLPETALEALITKRPS
jgi:glycerol-3-phosphate dehydrogenase